MADRFEEKSSECGLEVQAALGTERILELARARLHLFGLWKVLALFLAVALLLAVWPLGWIPIRFASLTSVTLTPQEASLPKGLIRQFHLTGKYSDGSIRDLTASARWDSTNAGALSIDSSGMATAVGVGDTTIRVTSGSTVSNLKVSVTPPALAALAISPSNLSVARGTKLQFRVTGTASDSASDDFTERVQYVSTNPSAVAIGSSGIAQALGAGRSVIRATYGGVATQASLTVTLDRNGFAGILMSRNDSTRTAQNLNETILTPANVSAATFGKKFANPVDGYVYAQPLYVPKLTIPDHGTHNVVYVATESNSVYAFDADAAGPPLWVVNLGTPAPQWALPCKDIQPTVGITSTPAIDMDSNTMYVVARTLKGRTNYYYLHALDIGSGVEKFGGPVEISATVPGTAEGSHDGKTTFDPLVELQRPGLVVSNGSVYFGFGSNCDFGFFHGWLFAYDARTLSQKAVFLTTPHGAHGGIWQAGAAPAVDGNGNMYLVTGDGDFDANIDGQDYGDSILKLSLNAPGLSPTDYFSPFNELRLFNKNSDLGTGGVILLPDQVGVHSHLLMTAGKDGTIYLVDRDSLGHFKSNSDNQIVQSLSQKFSHRFHSSPAFWQGDSTGWVYLGAVTENLKAFSLTDGRLSDSPTSQSSNTFGYPGPAPAVSSNGKSNGIVWALSNLRGGEQLLNAYDARDLGKLLYCSNQAANNRDKADPWVKFVVPTIANGRVYFGTRDHLDVYGLLH
jgi:hypothetical protein